MSQAVLPDAVVDAQGSESPPTEKRLPVAAWAIPLVAFSLIPSAAAQAFDGQIHAFRVPMYLAGTTIVLVVALLTTAFLYFVVFPKDVRRSAGTGAVLTFVFFTWPIWLLLGQAVRQVVDVGFVADVATVGYVAVLIWLTARLAANDAFVGVVTLVAVAILVALAVLFAPRLVLGAAASAGPQGAVDRPDVVVLVLDGHARDDVLARDYATDGSLLVAGLRERGFVVGEDALSNYNMTYASLATVQALDYSFPEGVRSDANLNRMRSLLSGDSPLIRSFDEAGYSVTLLESAWWGSNCGPWIDECHRTGLLRRAAWSLGEVSPLAAIQRFVVPHPFVVVGLQHLDELGELLDGASSTPQLVFAHVTIPHPPLELNAACEVVVESDRAEMIPRDATDDAGAGMIDRERYREQLQCVDARALAAIDRLVAASDDVAMLVMSDHGPASRAQALSTVDGWTDDALVEQFAVLSAARVPEACESFEMGRTSVNTTRSFLNCVLGTELPELPDRSYAVPHENVLEGAVLDVTERLFAADPGFGG